MIIWMIGNKHDRRKKLSESRIVSNVVVLMALKNLAAYANKSTGISHSSDKQHTINIFKTLKKNREPFEPTEIKSWFILKAKWKPQFAQDIAEIAQKIKDGKQVRSNSTIPFTLKEDAIDRWKEEAKDSTRNSEEWRGL